MNKFSNLLNNLLLTSSKKKKIKLLVEYFRSSNVQNRAWAFSILNNNLEKKFLSSKDLKEIIYKQVDEDLFKFSYDYVGDLAETISLLWKNKINKKFHIELHELMNFLINKKSKELLKKKIESILSYSNENQRYSILKILTGGLRVGVSTGLIKESLVIYGRRKIDEIEEYWHGFRLPYIDFFQWLEGKDLPDYIDKKQLFNSFMLANNFKMNDFKGFNTSDFFAEFK